ncbi:MAG: D-2-hydroxyacid dehydrogenase [Brevinematales bacterium]|nr:D-2-hydroxyacid dehydrogenase [Brevinematales bacterium]
MHTREIAVYLTTDIRACTVREEQIFRIRNAFPDFNVTLCASVDDFVTHVHNADYAVTWEFKKEWYAGAPFLHTVFTPAAGREWIEPDPSGRTPTIFGRFHGKLMRETLLAMMLYFNRRVAETLQNQTDRKWERDAYSDTHSLTRQTVLIIGYGNIGRECAKVLKALGAKVIGVKRDLSKGTNDNIADSVITFDNIAPALREADHVALILPGGRETDGIINRSHLENMKKTAYIYNMGRGNCIGEDDIVWAVTYSKIAGFWLDVFDKEPLPLTSKLWRFPNVVITPHSSAFNAEYLDLYFDELIQIIKYLETKRGA